MILITWLASQFGSWGLPEPLRKAAAWLAVIVAAVALLWAAKAAYDASVIHDSDNQRAVDQIPAVESAAEQRADDAVRNILADREREEAITKADKVEQAKPVAERAVLPPTTLALNCARLKRAGMTDSAVYKEKCR